MITWTPTSTEAIVSPGETKTVSVSFVSSKNIRRASVQVSPELATFVHTAPLSFERIRTGEQQTLTLIVAPSASSTLGTIVGSIQLQRGKVDASDTEADDEDRRDAGKLLPQPLKVVLNAWNSFTNANLQLAFKFPPFGQPMQVTVTSPRSGKTIADFQLLDAAQQNFISEFELVIYDNPAHLSLQDWFEQNIDADGILTANGTFQQQQLGNGLVALVLVRTVPEQYAQLNGPVEEAYALSLTGDRVLSIAQSQENTMFNLGFSQQSITNLLIKMLGTAQF